MIDMKFEVVKLAEVPGEEWLHFWSARYDGYDRNKYKDLIDRAKQGQLSSEDYESIGRWKDNVRSEDQWKENVASVAYSGWQQIAEEKPPCPSKEGVREFLEKWSAVQYRNQYRSGLIRDMTFGLPRATTLLHFLSVGRYPIFDSRVQTAVRRITNRRVMDTVPYYMDEFLPLFKSILDRCGTTDGRLLDEALFAYDSFKVPEVRKTG